MLRVDINGEYAVLEGDNLCSGWWRTTSVLPGYVWGRVQVITILGRFAIGAVSMPSNRDAKALLTGQEVVECRRSCSCTEGQVE